MRLCFSLYYSIYFGWYGKRCSWCETHTETAHYSGDGKDVEVCDACVGELCMMCYEKEMTCEDGRGFYYCADCFADQCDRQHEMRKDY